MDPEIYDLALTMIGERLREIRKEKGFTNNETFAFAHRLNRSKYGKYENGQNMELKTFLKILINAQIDPLHFFSTINEDLLKLADQKTTPNQG
jgi:transcriptional regulator with XRE-family HTH domain